MTIMKGIWFLCLLLIIFSAASSAENDILESFSKAVGVAPPGIPSTDDIVIPGNAVSMILRDSNNNLVTNAHVLVEMSQADRTIKTLFYVDETGILDLHMDDGVWTLVLKVDILDTQGSDYYVKQTINPVNDANTSITLNPVGSLRGTVYLGESIARNAEVSIECTALYGEKTEKQTDKYGSFNANWLPLGNCKVSAAQAGKVGSATVQITHGGLTETDIMLEKGVSYSGAYYYVLFLIIIALILLVVYYYVKSGRKRQPELSKEEPKDKKNKRLDDILSTLGKKEREVVELLCAKGELSQSYIVHNLVIPKTTLVRMLSGLESKKVVWVKKVGKSKKIGLTDWILEKN